MLGIGKLSVTRELDGLMGENHCPVNNFEQLEAELYPGMAR